MAGVATSRSVTIGGPAMWALAGLGLYLVVGAGSLFLTGLVADPILGAMGLPVEAGKIGLSVRNAIHPIAWGVMVAVASVPIGRRLVGEIRFSLAGNVLLGVGLGLAAITWFLGEEFVRARYEYFDPEYIGFSLIAWPAIVAVALAGWAALAAPPNQRTALAGLLLLAAAGLGLALLPSMIGAADGIRPENVPLAIAFLLDVLYAVAVIVATVRGIRVSGDGS
jgi:hypothetical protein